MHNPRKRGVASSTGSRVILFHLADAHQDPSRIQPRCQTAVRKAVSTRSPAFSSECPPLLQTAQTKCSPHALASMALPSSFTGRSVQYHPACRVCLICLAWNRKNCVCERLLAQSKTAKKYSGRLQVESQKGRTIENVPEISSVHFRCSEDARKDQKPDGNFARARARARFLAAVLSGTQNAQKSLELAFRVSQKDTKMRMAPLVDGNTKNY